jgi:aspartate/methionine/tyrosine aminotransferase
MMNELAEELNKKLGTAASFLSKAGKRMYFPYGGILGQGAEAAKCSLNATIGMAFEEDGTPLVMDCFRKNINLDKSSFLYVGSFGHPRLRAVWREMQYAKNPSFAGMEFSLPVVTNALTHGLRVTAELFADSEDEVVVPDLYWDNYELLFSESVGARLSLFETFKNGKFNSDALRKALLSGGNKKILILNFPNNPTGYTATNDDAAEIVKAVADAADAGKKIVVVLDDAYFGLVYEDNVHGESLFSEFGRLSENVLAVKIDGTTKEDYVWGVRVGFITFAFKGATADQLKALEAKAAGNVRSSVSNITSLGQHLALAAFSNPDYEKQKQEKYEVLKSRYDEIRRIFAANPEYAEAFEVMPFNSGYFMCVRPKGVDAETVRRHLIEKYSTGTIVLSGLLRIAFSTVPKVKLATLFANIASAIKDLRA